MSFINKIESTSLKNKDCKYVSVKTLISLVLHGCIDKAVRNSGKVWKKSLGNIETRLCCLWQDLFIVLFARAYISSPSFPLHSISLLSVSHTATPRCVTHTCQFGWGRSSTGVRPSHGQPRHRHWVPLRLLHAAPAAVLVQSGTTKATTAFKTMQVAKK